MREHSGSLRLAPLVLACICAALCAFAAAAQAGYGGLGAVGSIAPGFGHNQVEVAGSPPHHGFIVNPIDGSFYIADQQTETTIRVQKFSEAGAFVAEAKLAAPAGEGVEVGGLAIDPLAERVYLLIDAARPVERPPIVKKKEEDEAKKEVAEEKNEKAKVKKLEEEIERLEAEIAPFDAETEAAFELLAFSTKNTGETLPAATGAGIKNGAVAEEKELQPFVEEEKQDLAPLLKPRGLAVDTATHDVLILGQQDVAAAPERGPPEGENLRAVAQRIHTEVAEKKVGPRYLDKENCLGGGPEAKSEACGETEFEAPLSSPIVIPSAGGGRLVGVREGSQGELWELPATANDTTGFTSAKEAKREPVEPKQVFQLNDLKELVNFGGDEAGAEQGNTMAFTPTGAGRGRIELVAKLDTAGGVGSFPGPLIIGYDESAPQQFLELGWTGGVNAASKEKAECVVPQGFSSPVLVGGGGKEQERTLVFDTVGEPEKHVSLLAFGSGASAEQCGTAKPGALKAELNGVEVQAVKLTSEPTFTGEVKGANALSTTWKFENLTTGTKEKEETTGFGEEQPILKHKFAEPGKYKITAVITPDDFESPLPAEATEVQVEGTSQQLSATIAAVASSEVGKVVSFTAKAVDPFPHTSLTYRWEYGDGTTEETTQKTTGGGESVGKHSYGTAHSYTVHVEVTDGAHNAVATHFLTVTAPPPPEQPQGSGSGSTSGGGGSTGGGGKTEVLAFVEAHLATSSVTVSPSGALAVMVSCKNGGETCVGRITLRTLKAVATARHKKKRILQLASASFSLAAGQTEKITLRLSGTAKTVLKRQHTLQSAATVVAHGPGGKTQETQSLLTLKLAKKKKKH